MESKRGPKSKHSSRHRESEQLVDQGAALAEQLEVDEVIDEVVGSLEQRVPAGEDRAEAIVDLRQDRQPAWPPRR